jgi:hypothetical protein
VDFPSPLVTSIVNSAVPALNDWIVANLEAVRIAGSFTEALSLFVFDLNAMTAAYEKRTVSFEELQELRHELSRAYVDRGYVTSGVVIPDQSVTDGVIVLEAVEGELGEIDVQGNHRFREQAITKRIERYVQEPLDIADLQASLEMIRDDPLVERVNAQLLPGAELGQTYLRLGITERPPLEIDVTASNDRSTSVGEDRGVVGVTYRGLIGNGDVVSGRFGFTDGVHDNLLSYHVPLTPRGVALDILGTDQEADIVEEPFKEIDIESRLKSVSFTATYPFRKDYARTLTGVLGFAHKHSESTLLDVPPFSAGEVDGRAERLQSPRWTHRTGSHIRRARNVSDRRDKPTRRSIKSGDSDFELFSASFVGSVSRGRRPDFARACCSERPIRSFRCTSCRSVADIACAVTARISLSATTRPSRRSNTRFRLGSTRPRALAPTCGWRSSPTTAQAGTKTPL